MTHREIAKKGGAASRDGPALEHRLRATASRWRGLASNYQRPRASNAPERLPGHPKWSPGLPPGSILELWGSRSPQGTKNHQHRSYLGPIPCPFGARMNHTIPNDCWTGMYRFYEDSEFGLHMAPKNTQKKKPKGQWVQISPISMISDSDHVIFSESGLQRAPTG